MTHPNERSITMCSERHWPIRSMRHLSTDDLNLVPFLPSLRDQFGEEVVVESALLCALSSEGHSAVYSSEMSGHHPLSDRFNQRSKFEFVV
jgi:hypothetical protein